MLSTVHFSNSVENTRTSVDMLSIVMRVVTRGYATELRM
jgi:hypothetical protein